MGQKLTRIFVNWKSCFKEFVAPQGSVNDLFLFSIYLNDLFILTVSTEMCYFADDTTFSACDKDLNSLIKRLEDDRLLAIEWSLNNNMD